MDETLKKRNMEVKDLRTDLCDGIRLINFFELLCGHQMTEKYDKVPTNRIQKINNLSLALRFMERNCGVRNPGCSAEDVIDAEDKGIKMILGMLYVLYRKYRMRVDLADSGGSKKTREEDMLLEWVRTVLKNKGFEEEAESVQSFRSSFNDGRVFLALAKCFDGDAETFDYEEEREKAPKERLETAFGYAESNMGVAHLLDATEVAADRMDERALALYTSLFYHAFKTRTEMDEMQRSMGERSEQLELQKKGKEELVKMNVELSEQLAALRKEFDALKDKYERQKEQLGDVKKRSRRERKLIQEKEQELTEMHSQSRVNSSGLVVLRTNLEAHLSDLHRWQKFLDGTASTVEDPVEEIAAITDDLDKASFQEQLNILSAALQEESVAMGKILKEREGEKAEQDGAGKDKKDKKKRKHEKKSRRKHRHHKEDAEEEEAAEEEGEDDAEEEEEAEDDDNAEEDDA